MNNVNPSRDRNASKADHGVVQIKVQFHCQKMHLILE